MTLITSDANGATTADFGVGRPAGSETLQYVSAYINTKFLRDLDDNLIFKTLCRRDGLPGKAGVMTHRWLIMTAAEPSGAGNGALVLTEGDTAPNQTNMTMTAVEATLEQHGDFMQWSDLVDMTSLNPVLVKAQERLSWHAQRYLDDLIYRSTNGMLNTTTTEIGPGPNDSTGKLTAIDLVGISSYFSGLDIDPHESSPGGQYYIYVTHPKAAYQLYEDTGVGGWVDVHKNVHIDNGGVPNSMGVNSLQKQTGGGADRLYKGSPGSYAGVIVCTTNLIQPTGGGSGSSEYQALAFGAECFGLVPFMSNFMNPQIIVKHPGPQTMTDPLNQIQTIMGWKVNVAYARLRDAAILPYYSEDPDDTP